MTVSLDSHDGLRGYCAVWVMIFHCVLQSKPWPIDLQGSSVMPLFFILSGYSLAVSYSKKSISRTSNVMNPMNSEGVSYEVVNDIEHSSHSIYPDSQMDSSSSQTSINSWKFYQSRIARVYPVYLICTFFALPLWPYGYGGINPTNMSYITLSLITSVIPTCTWFIFLFGSSIDGPGWTICTLFGMWAAFPYFFSQLRSISDEKLIEGIANLYWVQLVSAFVLFFFTVGVLGFWPAFALSTMNPITRFPLFLMGIYAGELASRRGVHTILTPTTLCLFPKINACCAMTDNDSTINWQKSATSTVIVLLIGTLIVSTIDTVVRYSVGASVLGAVWFQAIIPFAQLRLVVALSLDQNQSLVSKYLNLTISKFLGRISMTIYLIHYPLIFYLCWIIHGSRVVWPTCTDTSDACVSQWINLDNLRRIPIWGIPIVVLVTLAMSSLLTIYVEEPCRRLFRARE